MKIQSSTPRPFVEPPPTKEPDPVKVALVDIANPAWTIAGGIQALQRIPAKGIPLAGPFLSGVGLANDVHDMRRRGVRSDAVTSAASNVLSLAGVFHPVPAVAAAALSVGAMLDNVTGASDRLAGTEGTRNQSRRAGKRFGEMGVAEVTLHALFNSGMKEEARRAVVRERLAEIKHALEGFGG